MLHAYIVRTCKCRQDGDEREKSWKSIRLPIQLHIPRLPIPIQKREKKKMGTTRLFHICWFLFLFPSGKCPRLTFWKDIETKEQSPQLPKGRFFFFFFFVLFRFYGFPISLFGSYWRVGSGNQSRSVIIIFFFPFFSKENLVIKGSKAKK
jgi:hypothetical protein